MLIWQDICFTGSGEANSRRLPVEFGCGSVGHQLPPSSVHTPPPPHPSQPNTRRLRGGLRDTERPSMVARARLVSATLPWRQAVQMSRTPAGHARCVPARLASACSASCRRPCMPLECSFSSSGPRLNHAVILPRFLRWMLLFVVAG